MSVQASLGLIWLWPGAVASDENMNVQTGFGLSLLVVALGGALLILLVAALLRTRYGGVLVVGGAGFLGLAVATWFFARGHAVTDAQMARAHAEVLTHQAERAKIRQQQQTRAAASAGKVPAKPQPSQADGAKKPAPSAAKEAVKPAASAATTEKKTEPPRPNTGKAVERPAWVDVPEGRTDQGYQMTVVAGPYQTEVECTRELPGKLEEALNRYAERYAGPGLPHLDAGAALSVQPSCIREYYWETLDTSVGPMKQLHAQLVFDKSFHGWFDRYLHQQRMMVRLGYCGAAFLALLALMATVWAGLKLSLARAEGRGGGLRGAAAVVAVVMGLVLLGLFLV